MNTDSDAAQWRDLGLSDDLLSLIEQAGFKSPTPIQSKAIPLALKGEDLVASAQTGSGKTACFCFPMIEKMKGRKGTYGLILSPTREIALQTQQTLEQFATPLGIRSVSLIGGVNLRSDEERLKAGPHILVGTPGRICDHLERGNLWLEYIEMLVLDEADRMLDMGFAKELNRITSEISDSRQTLLFSATIAPEIERLAKRILHNPKRVQVGRALSTNRNVDQKVLFVNESQKLRELMYLLEEERETVIVFNRTKDNTFKLWRSSLDYGMEDSTYISSNKRQSDREKALEGFKDGAFRILFATDVAGRGIHVENVGHVINYDLPEEPEDYIHRIGRTGRRGATGKATSFVTPREMGQLRRIERVLGSPIPSEEAPGFRMESSSRGPSRGRRSSGPQRGGGRGSSRGRSSGRSSSSGRRGGSSRSGSSGGRSRGGSGGNRRGGR
ncbi:MAG: DEAD/DEAH box helicase [Bdellovibrionaceae bacterium]|nr:DEAD/DEAH box helicase [Pseudobdellovibrionaceae bacterium]